MYSSITSANSGACSAAEHKMTFRTWRRVPKDQWRSVRDWKLASRKVKAGEKPTGRVIYVKVLTGPALAFIDPVDDEVLYQDHEHAEVVAKQWPLFHISQTEPAKIKPRTLAVQKYLDIFYRYARKDQYATRQLDPETGTESWITVTANGSGDKPWQRDELLEDHLIQHVNHSISRRRIGKQVVHRHTIAVKSTELTRFVALDIDHHAKDDTEIFLRRVELLLNHFHGDGWHYQVRDGAVTGIHFIKVFDTAIPLDDARQHVQAVLAKLDQDHPDLDFPKTEVFPTQDGNGFRLPLAKGYLMILDTIVEPVLHRKKQAGDVEKYMAWLEDPNRQYFPKDRLLSFLRMNAEEKPTPAQPTSAVSTPSELGSLKGRCWQTITGYWLGAYNPPNCLDAVTVVTARMAYFFGHTEQETIATISRFSRELPREVHHSSSRLLAGDCQEIDRCIAKAVTKVYRDNAGQPDVASSDQKLQAATAAWSMRGVDILNKTTWGKVAQPVQSITLTEQDRDIIYTYLAPVLGPAKYQHLACDVAIAMARLVDYKMHCPVRHVRQRAISYEYWRKFLKGNFNIHLGNKNKVAAILQTAEAIGVIQRWCGASKALKRAIIYQTGKRLKKYMDTRESQDSLYNGSILFAYHFQEEWDEGVNNDEKIRMLIGD